MGKIVLTKIREHMLSVRNGFSESQGLSSCNTQMQLKDLDDRTRIVLFNKITSHLSWHYANKDGARVDGNTFHEEDSLYRDVSTACGKMVDPNTHYYISEFNNLSKLVLTRACFNEVFDFIELVCKYCRSKDDLVSEIDSIFEREYVGYRFVDGKITPITDKNEIESIEEACNNKFEGTSVHIKKAVGFLADREHKDYQNCIKESISAVESICSIVAEQKKSLLGDALRNLKKKGVKIHPQLESAFSKLYDYTNSEKGIRHANGMFESDVTFEEAKFMLVSCSAFVNYLTANYGKVGGKHA